LTNQLFIAKLVLLGPKIDWDPDIVAALDSDYEESIDGELDDDFVTMANQSGDDMSQDDMSVGDRQSKWLEEQMLPSAERYVLSLQFMCGHSVDQI